MSSEQNIIHLLFMVTLLLYLIEVLSGMHAVVTLLVMIGMLLTEREVGRLQRGGE